MAARHHRGHKAGGGRTESGVTASMARPKDDWTKDADVEKDAKDGMKRGGGVKKKHDGYAAGGMACKPRLDRPGRKRGGRCGSDMAPLSSAAKTTKAAGVVSSEAGE